MRLYSAEASRRALLRGIARAAGAAVAALRTPRSRRARDRKPTSSTRTPRTASNGARFARRSSRRISAGRLWGRSVGRVGVRSTRASESDAATRRPETVADSTNGKRSQSAAPPWSHGRSWRLACPGAGGSDGTVGRENRRRIPSAVHDEQRRRRGQAARRLLLLKLSRRRWRQQDEGRPESRGPATFLEFDLARERLRRRRQVAAVNRGRRMR